MPAVEHGVDIDDDTLLFQQAEPTCQPRSKLWMILGAASAVACVVGAAASLGRMSSGAEDMGAISRKEDRVRVVKSLAACSTSKDNCLETGCCQISGHQCYVKSAGVGRCNSTCTPGVKGFECGQPNFDSVPARGEVRTDLYCFSVYTADTGSPKPSTELALLKGQKKFGASIFGCEAWDVFSDVTVGIAADYNTVQVEDTNKEFHQVKRKETGTWVNWAMFYQVWLKIRERNTWASKGWTVKVDADAVFIPQRLKDFLSDKKDTDAGRYFENCKNVQYGFFGNLEVLSNKATEVLTTWLEECHARFAPCANDGCDWKFGAWGEDVFVQRCMDHHYINKGEAFDLTKDGACPSDRPADQKKNKKWRAPDCGKELAASVHPFKKPQEYFKCLGDIMQTTYSV